MRQLEGIEGKGLPAQIRTASDEAAKRKRVPVLSPDLRHRVERRVAALGTPIVRGIGAGVTPEGFWPGAKQAASGTMSAAASRTSQM